MNKKRNYIIFFLVVAGLIYMMKDAFWQPGPQDLKGKFKELGFTRNENNTGPILRLYSVSLQDTLWNEMETYGNYMPHTKYGVTKVFFFLEGTTAPSEISLETQKPDAQYLNNCVGMYEKDANSQVHLTRFPFQ
ncbi:hypothetical protein ADIARSV_4066 [Arcticibacter svalbardensis MN12-7]|uniref:Uncharacterized protein n=1 Tax=Arcticibacter svalbardensis MN12-7 TaxID=1150600 RepID=R9GV30_9SPHI|nr:hypothetical protein [Arcticibacter svalbardensis]EOR92784.1 hypothetical protein ADIARSV_4066 [Arcticibacter svalbardensis MN12-7]